MCILCGINHSKGAPCDFTGADSLLADKITIHAREHVSRDYDEPKIEQPLSFETEKATILDKKKGRNHGKRY